MKINEPKTPFHYETSEEADDDEVPFHIYLNLVQLFAVSSTDFLYQGQEHGTFLGGGGAVSSVCPNQLHDALASVSALHQVKLPIACAAVRSFHLNLFHICSQYSSPERLSSPDCHADHHSDASLLSAHSSDSEDSFKAKRKQHYRMGAALKGQAPMGM